MANRKPRTVSVMEGDPFLAELFSSQVRADVLVWLFSHRQTAVSLTELAKALGLAISSVQHEVYKLERLELIVGRRDGNSRRYRLTVEQPMTLALERLIYSAMGLEAALQAVLSDTPGLVWSIVATPSRESLTSAVLVLVGKLELDSLASIQTRVATVLDVSEDRISTSFHSEEVWRQHLQGDYPLIQRLKQLETLAMYGDIS